MHAIAFLLGASFLGGQVTLLMVLLKRLKEEQELYQKCVDGTTPRVRLNKDASPWISWLDLRFPPGKPTTGQWDREDALREFDHLISVHPCYQLLLRATVMAPLVGVLITASGFMIVDMPEGDGLKIQQIVKAISPLYLGVITGALLAIVNQVLLLVVSARLEETRKVASDWFDKEIWPGTATNPETAAVMLTNNLTSVGGKIAATAEQCTKAVEKLESAATSTKTSTDGFAKTVSELGSKVTELIVHMDETCTAVAKLQPIVNIAETSTERFRKAVDESFAPSADNAANAFQQLVSLKNELEPVLEALSKATTSAKEFKELPNRITETVKTMETGISDMQRNVLHSQVRDLEDLLAQVFKQVALFSSNGNGS